MKWLALVVPVLFVISCSSDPRPVRLSVAADEFVPGIIEEITYSCNGEIIEDPDQVFDSAKSVYESVWDTAATGEYTVALTSVFGTTFTQRFNVNCDSVLHIKNELPYQSVSQITMDTLMKADTVQFVRVSKGCFHHDVRKTTLVRTDNGYDVTEIPTPPFTDPAVRHVKNDEAIQYLQALYEAELDIEKLRVENAGKVNGSTSRQYLFLRADNLVYHYYDDGAKWMNYPINTCW